MIIGNGLIATTFLKYENSNDILIFASGVSNSTAENIDDYKREETLLLSSLENNKNKFFVYFSSCDLACSIVNQKSYYQHKLKMENIVRKSSTSYHIFRLPQVIGPGGNKNTLINFLISCIKEEKQFNLFFGTYKSIIDVSDVSKMCSYIIDHNLYKNKVVNIINHRYVSVEKLVNVIEDIFQINANYKSVEIISKCKYDDVISKTIALKLKIIFDDKYIENIVRKYHG